MERGEIWSLAGGPYYATKPRPVAIIQSNLFHGTESVTVCPFTSHEIQGPLFRIPVYPSGGNGLRSPSWLETDKIVTVPRSKLGARIGILDSVTLAELSRAITIFLHLTPDPVTRRR